MAFGLSSWLALVRCVQIMASLTASGFQAFLVGYISANKLGLAQNGIALQFMTTAWFAFAVLVLSLVHTGGRSTKTPWLVAAIVGDVAFIGIGIAMISILSYAGLPSHCGGITRTNYIGDDARQSPKQGYTTIRFSNQYNGAKGELDRYCILERVIYIVTIALILSAILSLVLAVLRICEGSYIKITKANQMILDRCRDEEKLRLQPHPHEATQQASSTNSEQSHQSRTRDSEPAAPRIYPASEGVLSARTSVAHRTQQQRYQQQQQQQQQPLLASPTSPIYTDQAATASSSRADPFGADFSRPTPEEEAAAAALITDGSSSGRRDLEGGYGYDRTGGGGLPPYTPGRLNPMSGHGDESNEMRLSEYVKGGTRAQDMKDGMR